MCKILFGIFIFYIVTFKKNSTHYSSVLLDVFYAHFNIFYY